MDKEAKEALQVTKEIMVKFIETNRASPINFSELFPSVYRTVLETITDSSAVRPEKNTGKSKGE